MSNIETQTRCEDDFHLLSTIFTDIIYNTIHNIAIHKSESNSNIRLEDLYISSLQLFGDEIKKYSTFKKIIIQFINTIQIHTDYKNIGYESTIYRLFHHFIINQNKNYEFNDQIKFLNKLFINTYSKFNKIIIESYLKIILFDRQNIEYHKKLQTIFYDILINEKKIFQSPSNVKYNSKINTIQLVNDFSILKQKFIKQEEQLEYYKNKFNESTKNILTIEDKNKLLSKINELEADNNFINQKNIQLFNDNELLIKQNLELSNQLELLNSKYSTKSTKNIKSNKVSSNKVLSTRDKNSNKIKFKNNINIIDNNNSGNNSDSYSDTNSNTNSNTNTNTNTNTSNKKINDFKFKESSNSDSENEIEIENDKLDINLNNDNNILFSDIDSDSDNYDNKSLFIK
jgi:hypothetical protein